MNPFNDPTDFPCGDLTPLAREAVIEVHQQTKSAMPIVGTSAISAMSLLCQPHHVLQHPNGKVSPISIYALTAVESGADKTACDKAFLGPFRSADGDAFRWHQTLMTAYLAELNVWETEHNGILVALKKAAQKGEDATHLKARLIEHQPRKPVQPGIGRYIFDDATRQALLLGLSNNGGCGGLISDEAGKLFSGSMFSECSTLSQIFDGTPIPVERVGSYLVEDPKLTISLMIQPGPLDNVLNKPGNQLRHMRRC